MKIKLLLLFVLALFPFASLFAFDCEVDGIYYNRLSVDEFQVTNGTEMYSGDVEIPETVMYRDKVFKVTQIGYYAFQNCKDLTSVIIPQTITSLPSSAFLNCSSLTTITMSSNVTTIGNNAFEGCKSLSSIVIPEGVTAISNKLFNGCEKLASVTLPQGITTIGEGAFMGCKSLTMLSLPNQISSIEKTAFKNCTGLASIVLPEELTTITESTFEGCSGLVSIVMPDKITRIGPTAFLNCTSLSSIVFSNALYSIGASAFQNCTSLFTVSMPSSVHLIGKNAFYGCTGLKKVIVNDMAAWYNIWFESPESNPLHYARHLYSDEETEIKELFIDNSVSSIGNYAFYNAENLLGIYIFSYSPPSIHAYTFGNTCYTWTDVYVPEKRKEIFQNSDYWRNFKSVSDLSPTVDGIKYDITTPTEAKVTCLSNDEKYSGQITIPESITFTGKTFNVVAIENEAFKDCSELVSVSIPNSVTSIGESAFIRCSSLTSVNIPDSIKEIPQGMFAGCTKLTKVSIPDNVKVIGNSSFNGCSSLECINIPNHVTRIGEWTFMGCSSLSSIDLPDSLTYIGGQSFKDCSSLYSIAIPRNVSIIGYNAFIGCDRLTLVASLNETPPSLDMTPFLKDIPILLVPLGCKDAYKNDNSSGWGGWEKYTYWPNVLEFDFDEGEFLVLKSSYKGGKIVYNGQETTGETKVFAVKNGNDIPLNIELDANCEFISCVIDGDSIKEFTREANNTFSCTLKADKGHIVDATFAKLFVEDSVVVCDNMYYKILQGNEVELFPRIGYFGFSDGNLTPLYSGYSGSVVIPDSIVIPASLSHPQREYIVTGINNRAFQDGYYGSSSTKLTSVVIGNNVTSIPDSTFYRCKNLTSVTIGNNVTSIGNSAFFLCSNLTSMRIPRGVKSLPSHAFYCCHKLESVILPESITEIGDYAFVGCDSLKSIVFPNSLKSIGNGTFQNCYNLVSLIIPESVINISKTAFLYCSGLNSIIVKNGNPMYDSRENCNALIETNTNMLLQGCNSSFIPFGVTTINSYAFRTCSGLTSITIPNSVTSIDQGAFNGCTGLTSITIPNSVTSIGDYAFYGCTGLEEVKVMAEIPPVAYDETFSNYDIPLYVPESAVSSYQATRPWNKFKTFKTLSDIHNVTIDNDATATIYDLNGKRLQKPAKGINIIGGKKILKH